MNLVERHIINKNHEYYSECDHLAFLNKNIYNKCLYDIRQHFFNTGNYMGFTKALENIRYQYDYQMMPSTKLATQTIRQLDRNFNSFFKCNQDYKNKPWKYNGKPKIPKYLPKQDGRCMVRYTYEAISKKVFDKQGKIKLSKSNIVLNTKINDWNKIKEVRIVPKINHYIIEVVYEQECKKQKVNNNIASIDIGLNNLLTVTFNNFSQPYVFNGRPLKSINQYYNKELSFLKSELELKQGKKSSKRIKNLTDKREFKVNDYLHKVSHSLVNLLAEKDISTLVIGWNERNKQDINIGKVNNQNFVQLSIYKLINQIKYKAKLEGINVIIREESYTSKCSFLDNEDVKKHESYLGKRKKRGLFVSSTGELINADVNGSYNIMKKEFPNVNSDGIEGVAVHPLQQYVG